MTRQENVGRQKDKNRQDWDTKEQMRNDKTMGPFTRHESTGVLTLLMILSGVMCGYIYFQSVNLN